MCMLNPCQKLQLLNNTRISPSLLLKQLELTARLMFSGQIISILWEKESPSKKLIPLGQYTGKLHLIFSDMYDSISFSS